MSQSIKFFFDFGSPASYLAHLELPKVAKEAGATVEWVPVLLGGIFQAIGNSAPTDLPVKARWMQEDLALWAKKRGVPFEFNPHFPINTLVLQRGAVAFSKTPLFHSYLDAVYSAMWAEPKNLADPAVLAEVLTPIGISADDFLKRVSSQEVKDELRQNTEQAVRLGAFGCPSFSVRDKLFFGQDRLEFVADALHA
jgi:2-hydroxychromene-2-carboxylate isomerase